MKNFNSAKDMYSFSRVDNKTDFVIMLETLDNMLWISLLTIWMLSLFRHNKMSQATTSFIGT